MPIRILIDHYNWLDKVETICGYLVLNMVEKCVRNIRIDFIPNKKLDENETFPAFKSNFIVSFQSPDKTIIDFDQSF